MRATLFKLFAGLMLVAPLFLGAPATAQEAAQIVTEATPQKTSAEECRDRCNRDYDICADEGQASDQSMNGRPSAGFSKNHCSVSLNSCLARCRAL